LKELKEQFVSALLVILTVAAVIAAALNFQQQRKFHLPEDGVTWVDRGGSVQALYVEPGGPAARAGIRNGDKVVSISGKKIEHAIDVIQVLTRLGSWRDAQYVFDRKGVEAPAKVYVREHIPDSARFYQYAVGLAYLGIGLFVYFRRGGANKSVHFYVLCLTSFILSCFHYTGKLNNFDQVMFYGNVLAGALAPTIFLHFCLTFPEAPRWLRWRVGNAALYIPAFPCSESMLDSQVAASG